MRKMNRAVGYCPSVDCEQYARNVFLLNQTLFRCPKCHRTGKIVPETGRTGNSKPIFKEVRVEFDFDAHQDRFRSTAIVRDESLWGHHNVYHYSTPLVKTEKRALIMAEQILATLNQTPELLEGEELPCYNERRLNWDESQELFRSHCNHWGESLKDTPLTRSK